MDSQDNCFRLACCDLSDGPRLVLYGSMESSTVPLQSFFQKVCQVKNGLRLDQQTFVDAGGGVEVLALCKVGYGHVQGLKMIDPSKPRFEWSCDRAGWEELVELVSGMDQVDHPCHQYLNRNPSDDALFVVSKGEYTGHDFNPAHPDARKGL